MLNKTLTLTIAGKKDSLVKISQTQAGTTIQNALNITLLQRDTKFRKRSFALLLQASNESSPTLKPD